MSKIKKHALHVSATVGVAATILGSGADPAFARSCGNNSYYNAVARTVTYTYYNCGSGNLPVHRKAIVDYGPDSSCKAIYPKSEVTIYVDYLNDLFKFNRIVSC